MKNYNLLRFVKLNGYLFLSYTAFTSLVYVVTGRFSGEQAVTWKELLFNAAIFSLLFSLTILIWYRRTTVMLATTRINYKALQQRLQDVGYEPVQKAAKADKTAVDVYKPVPPKAGALAGKVFVQKTANFFIVEGPVTYLKKLEKE